MKAIHWIIAAAALSIAEPVQAGVNDPEVIIYRFPGVTDNGGGASTGVATVFHCTNLSGVPENIRFVTRRFDGELANNTVFNGINHLSTHTVSTHDVVAYIQALLNTGSVTQGTTAIAATSINIICMAETIDASSAAPVGVARRGIRFNPIPGSQE